MDAIGPQENRLLQLERKQVRLDDELSNLTKRLTTLEQRLWQAWSNLGGVPAAPTPTPTPTPTPCAMPTLAVLSNLTFCGDPGLTTVNLSGITDGMSNTALPITITCTSSNTTDIPTPTVSYTSPNTTGTLSFTPRAGLNNCATPRTISVKVVNSCNTGTRGGVNSLVRTFTVSVTQPSTPTCNNVLGLSWGHGSGNQTINLSGISAGPGQCAGGPLTVTAASDNPGVSDVVSVGYTSPNATGTVTVTTAAAGTAHITVTVTDTSPNHCGTAVFNRVLTVTIT